MAELGASLDEAAWKAPSECPGWSVQDNLVHITALERVHPRRPVADGGRARGPAPREERHRPLQRALDRVAPCLVRRRCAGGVRRHHRRPHRPAPRARRRRVRRRLLDADGAGHGRASSSAFRIFDSWVHEQDMRRALERPGDLDSDAARFSTQMMLDVLPYVVGKKVGAPDGSTVVLSLTGPLAATTAVGIDRRPRPPARPAPEVPPSRLSLASDDVRAPRLRSASIPTRRWSWARCAIDGDVELGRRRGAPAQLHVLNSRNSEIREGT